MRPAQWLAGFSSNVWRLVLDEFARRELRR